MLSCTDAQIVGNDNIRPETGLTIETSGENMIRVLRPN